ncbi:MAG: hypothetical protein A3E81_01615 [Gammaproteobacteria bacterium RIFCSPHIGHO2_12_FULL_36_30]|nr:MAG: hypothetical protein A3E81_01615 [Gammaproteobacteria bacterium RIFCSPHIGHO2_12_FULL_36_30]
MSVLIIGYGSIGSRHADILSRFGSTVSIVTAQKIQFYARHDTIEEALEKNSFDKIIIANATHLHYVTLKKIISLNFQGTILIEKPLFSQLEYPELKSHNNIYISYNLRFHPLLQYLRNLLQGDELVSFSVHAGSYLPDWRKNIVYQQCYSAKKESGGGVLRDLSHELDYILWICGKCIEVTAIGGHFSALEINSDDIYSILMRCENCPIINVQIDYLSRTPIRKILIQTKKHRTILLDLIEGTLIVNGEVELQVKNAIEQTYTKQHELIIQKNFTDMCDYLQGLAVMKLITTIEKSARDKKWITL